MLSVLHFHGPINNFLKLFSDCRVELSQLFEYLTVWNGKWQQQNWTTPINTSMRTNDTRMLEEAYNQILQEGAEVPWRVVVLRKREDSFLVYAVTAEEARREAEESGHEVLRVETPEEDTAEDDGLDHSQDYTRG